MFGIILCSLLLFSRRSFLPEPGAGAMTKGIVEVVDNQIDVTFGIQYKAYWDWPERQYWQVYLKQVRRFHHSTVSRRNLFNKSKDEAVLDDLDKRRIHCNQMVTKFLMGISKIHRDRTVVVVDTVNQRLRHVKRVQQGIKLTVFV